MSIYVGKRKSHLRGKYSILVQDMLAKSLTKIFILEDEISLHQYKFDKFTMHQYI